MPPFLTLLSSKKLCILYFYNNKCNFSSYIHQNSFPHCCRRIDVVSSVFVKLSATLNYFNYTHRITKWKTTNMIFAFFYALKSATLSHLHSQHKKFYQTEFINVIIIILKHNKSCRGIIFVNYLNLFQRCKP